MKCKNLLWMTMEEDCDNIAFLLKYFPKSYKTVVLKEADLRNKRVNSKLKAVKSIMDVNIVDYRRKSRLKVSDSLKSHQKHIRIINTTDPVMIKSCPKIAKLNINTQSLLAWSTFMRSLHIKTLTLELIGNQPSFIKQKEAKTKKLRSFQRRFWIQIKRLKDLKELNLQCSNHFTVEAQEFIQNLNQSSLLISNLDAFNVFLNHLKIGEGNSYPCLDKIFPYITNLRIHEVFTSTLQYILDNLGQLTNIKLLSLIRTVQLPEDRLKKLNLSSLSQLSGLTKLKTLEFSITLQTTSSFEGFLASFNIPKTVSSVTLNLFEIPWTDYISNYSNTDFKIKNPFSSDQRCIKFYETWKDLNSLDYFSLCFTEADKAASSTLYFMTPIFENLNRAKTVFFAQWYNMESGKRKAIDFGHIWDSVKHLNDSLEDFYIEAYAVSLKSLEVEEMRKRKLKNFGISGYVLDNKKLNDLVKLFGAKDGFKEKKPHLELERMIIDDKKALEDMLFSLKDMPKGLKLSLSMDIRKLGAKEFMDVFTELYRVQKYKKKNIMLVFYSLEDMVDSDFERICAMVCDKDLFGNVRFFDRSEEEIFNAEVIKEMEISQVMRNLNGEVDGEIEMEGMNVVENSSHSIDNEDDEDDDDEEEEIDDFMLGEISMTDDLDNIDDDF